VVFEVYFNNGSVIFNILNDTFPLLKYTIKKQKNQTPILKKKEIFVKIYVK